MLIKNRRLKTIDDPKVTKQRLLEVLRTLQDTKTGLVEHKRKRKKLFLNLKKIFKI